MHGSDVPHYAEPLAITVAVSVIVSIIAMLVFAVAANGSVFESCVQDASTSNPSAAAICVSEDGLSPQKSDGTPAHTTFFQVSHR